MSVGLLRGEARPQQQVIVLYIENNKQEYGVEPICTVLTEHGCPIAPSTYYETRGRAAEKRAVRDEQLKAEISRLTTRTARTYPPHGCAFNHGQASESAPQSHTRCECSPPITAHERIDIKKTSKVFVRNLATWNPPCET